MLLSQYMCLVLVKKDYSGSSTVQASVDVRSVGRSVGRRQIYAFDASLSSFGRHIDRYTRSTRTSVGTFVVIDRRVVRLERGYRPARASP